MLLTSRQARSLGQALYDAAARSDAAEQSFMIVCTPDTATAMPYKVGCFYDPECDHIVF